MPERIQLRRAKGWRKPAGAIVVARPSAWGNPWRVDRYRGDGRIWLTHHDRTYPKCVIGDGGRITAGAGTDVRGWWPACRDVELGDRSGGPDTARWTPNQPS